MRKTLVVMAVIILLGSPAALAQDGRATLDGAAKALGADGLGSLQLSGTGSSFAAGPRAGPGAPRARFTPHAFTLPINHETVSACEQPHRTRAQTVRR